MFGRLWRGPAVPLLRVRGIPIEAHWSVAIPMLAWATTLASTRYLDRYSGLPDTTITAMAIVTVLMFPGSILLHELGHATQAGREGRQTARITLWGFGGVAWIDGARSPGEAFRVAAAGPLVSVVLAPVLGALSWLADRAGLPGSVVGVLLLVAQFNAVVVVFNLLPVYPMDGGRILHAAMWRRRGLAFAAAWAPRIGVVVASLVIAFGAIAPFVDALTPRRLLTQSAQATPGLSIMFSGAVMLWWTLSARAVLRRRGARRELMVGDLLEAPAPAAAPGPETTVAHFLRETAGTFGYGTAPYRVLDDGRVVGLISPGLANQVPVAQREEATVADTMLRQEEAMVLPVEASVEAAFNRLQSRSGRGIVLDGKQVMAILVASDLAGVLLRVKDTERGVEPG